MRMINDKARSIRRGAPEPVIGPREFARARWLAMTVHSGTVPLAAKTSPAR